MSRPLPFQGTLDGVAQNGGACSSIRRPNPTQRRPRPSRSRKRVHSRLVRLRGEGHSLRALARAAWQRMPRTTVRCAHEPSTQRPRLVVVGIGRAGAARGARTLTSRSKMGSALPVAVVVATALEFGAPSSRRATTTTARGCRPAFVEYATWPSDTCRPPRPPRPRWCSTSRSTTWSTTCASRLDRLSDARSYCSRYLKRPVAAGNAIGPS